MKTCTGLLVVALSLSILSAADDMATFKVTKRKADDKVEVQADGEKAVFSVKSPSGIGAATIESVQQKWPKAVVLRLHLEGLESLVVANGKLKLNAAVSALEGKLRVRLWKDDKEDEPVDPKSAYWITIRLLGSDGNATNRLPLKNGLFEITLPQILFESNPKHLTVQWIDFYRG
jgi:hypothetical protein